LRRVAVGFHDRVVRREAVPYRANWNDSDPVIDRRLGSSGRSVIVREGFCC